MKSICRADSRLRLNTVSPCMNRIFLTGSRAGYQAHALFVYLAVSLFTKGFDWNVNFLFSPRPALCLPLTLLGNPLSFLSLFSDQPWQAQLLFYSDEWGPVFFFSLLENQTDCPCESLNKDVENQSKDLSYYTYMFSFHVSLPDTLI